MPVGLLYGCLQIVGDQYHRNSSEELQGLDGGHKELFYVLRDDTGNESVARVWQYGHIRLHKHTLSCLGISVAEPVAGEVYEHPLPRLIQVFKQRRRHHRLYILTHVILELGKGVTVGMFLTVFLPELPDGDMTLLYLDLKISNISLKASMRWSQ